MVSKLKTILEKPNVRNAIKDIELEGGYVTKDTVFIMDDYAEGRIDDDELLRKVLKGVKNDN